MVLYGPRRRRRALMSGSTKTMGVLTVATLVVVSAYTAALGSNGWLWFGWVVLGMVTIGVVASKGA
jgi:fatty acid desaturase